MSDAGENMPYRGVVKVVERVVETAKVPPDLLEHAVELFYTHTAEDQQLVCDLILALGSGSGRLRDLVRDLINASVDERSVAAEWAALVGSVRTEDRREMVRIMASLRARRAALQPSSEECSTSSVDRRGTGGATTPRSAA